MIEGGWHEGKWGLIFMVGEQKWVKTYDRMEKIFEILGMKLSRLKFIPNLD